MTKPMRNRHQQHLDQVQHYTGLAEKRPDEKAVERFKKPAYACTDVIGYLSKKYNIKGEIGSGQRDTD